jgi:hypothetical protein
MANRFHETSERSGNEVVLGDVKGSKDAKNSHANVEQPEDPTPLDLAFELRVLLPHRKNASFPR